MLVFAIIITVILGLALLRVGAVVVYNEDGAAVWAKVGFLRIPIDTKGGKKKKERKSDFDIKNLKPGSLGDFMDMLRAVKKTLGRLRRKLLIKKLTLYVTFAGDDPSKTAIQYGSASAAIGALVPALERHFRIKRRDIRAGVDFTAAQPRVYANIKISIAIWEIIYTALALLPVLKGIGTAKTQSGKGITDGRARITHRKDELQNGEGTDK